VVDDITGEFENADLKDQRRSRRLPKVAAALAAFPAASIAAATGGHAEMMAAYRLLNCPDITAAAVLAPHRESTIARCAAHRRVVVSQDTTELDFSHMTATTGLGPLNDKDRKGLYLHALYAVSEDGLPLGALDAAMIIRDPATFGGAKVPHKKRPACEKESQRWVEGYLKTNLVAARLPDCEVLSVSDREGDIFEVYAAWHAAMEQGDPYAGWIIRANQDRALTDTLHEDPASLFAALASAPLLGRHCFEVTARTGTRKVKGNRVTTHRSARTVHQEIRAMEVTPRPPYRKGVKLPRVSFWAVLAEETDPPAGEDPVRWLLLTSKPVRTLEEALEVIGIYRRRWDIEVFHRVLKTGCRVERIQLKSGQALCNALAIHLVVAWRILYLTHLGRVVPDLPCGRVFEEAEWRSACAVVKRDKAAGEPSLAEFIGIVSKLGGHLGRKSDGVPGAQSIWQGLARIRDFACAWRAFHGE
jgi:Transposase Tn5 dimerisation domain/Transposase DNA-binding